MTPKSWVIHWRHCAAVVLVWILAAAPQASKAATCPVWPLWEWFRKNHISQDGRVQDVSLPHRPTVSEGQAYAMFFSLVAGDRQQFSALLQWTENNLAGGSLAERAPGWHWGESDTGQWTLLDANPASDADLWMSYALLEAGQRWQHDAYTRLGLSLAEHLLRDASPVLPGLGRSLLPAPKGFQLGPTRWRLNPSYAPLPLLRRLAALTARSEWLEMLEPTLRLIVESAPHGISPEWAIWDANSGWQPDPETRGLGSYNAIRSYLWTGMSRDDPAFERLALGFLPWLHWVAQHGHAPESLNAQKAPSSQPMPAAGPPGFDGAALLLADSLRFSSLSRHLNKRLEPSLGSKSPGYYSHALLLFGLGWIEGRYRFATDGSLLLPGAPCEPHVD